MQLLHQSTAVKEDTRELQLLIKVLEIQRQVSSTLHSCNTVSIFIYKQLSVLGKIGILLLLRI